MVDPTKLPEGEVVAPPPDSPESKTRAELLESLGHPVKDLDHEEMETIPAARPGPSIGQDIKAEAEYAVPQAVKSVGGSVGEIAGAAAGAAIVKMAARHGPAMIAGLVVAAGSLGMILAARVVTKAFGKVVAGIAIGNIGVSAGIIVAAIITLNKAKKP